MSALCPDTRAARALSLKLRMDVRIDYLVNHHEHILTLAGWFKAQDSDFFAQSSLSEIAREHFESRLNTDALPISFIALDALQPIGTIALLIESVTTHTHLSPWLGALYVLPEFRHRGIGMSLVAHAMSKAQGLGLSSVYAGVSRAEQRYIAEAWRVHERVVYHGKPLCILRYDFGVRGTHAGL